jgi:predicted RNA-binding Zn-ribbon protein involved in translation (DUF1610 family)
LGHGSTFAVKPFGQPISLTRNLPLVERLGFQLARNHRPTNQLDLWGIGLPHWFILLLCLPFPLLWFRRFRQRRHRLHHGLCLSCGYDLRESPEKCPECGAKVERAAAANVAADAGTKG